jgi:type IV pilus assembly protein PilA
MIVIAIIGILAAIAIPQFITYRQKGYNTEAKSELKNLYTSCQAYFIDNPGTSCSTTVVSALFIPTTDIHFGGIPSTDPTLIGVTAAHQAGTSTYTIGSSGNITP